MWHVQELSEGQCSQKIRKSQGVMDKREQGTDHVQPMGHARDSALLSEKKQESVLNGQRT